VYATAEEIATSPGQLVYVNNRSSVPVTVYSVTLRECQNVKQSCGVRPVNLHINAGGRVQILRVEPSNPQNALTYRYSFGWRADSSTAAALTALAQAGDTVSQERLAAMRREEVRRRNEVGAQDLDLTPAEMEAFGPRAAMLRPVPDSLVVNVNSRTPLDAVRLLLIGTNNETLGRVRGVQWRLSSSPAIEFVRPDTVVAKAPGRAVLQLKLPDTVLPNSSSLHEPVLVPIVIRQ
jgi:hypothetical protein